MTGRDTPIALIDHAIGTRQTLTLGAFLEANVDGLTDEEIVDISTAVESGEPYFAAFHMGGDYEIRALSPADMEAFRAD